MISFEYRIRQILQTKTLFYSCSGRRSPREIRAAGKDAYRSDLVCVMSGGVHVILGFLDVQLLHIPVRANLVCKKRKQYCSSSKGDKDNRFKCTCRHYIF